jgi:hypothetical protein
MKPTTLVNLNKEPYDVYIGRPSKWGNPYTHIIDKETLAEAIVSSRDEAISKYREYILATPELINGLDELEGKTLGCFCIPNDGSYPIPYVCHGQVLIELISQKKLKDFFNKK